ncbi:MAG: hypothetical protein IIC75_02090 [Bacteroidetes bacterium]|nr:hypothetical protein [Bacteroidota bacterium]
MKFITSYFSGLISALKNIKILFVIYFIAFIFAFIIASAFKSAIANATGSSMALLTMLKDFDYSTYSNFMHLFRDTISPLIKVAFLFGIFYSIFSIFFSGGIISKLCKKSGRTSLSIFWADSWAYFWRFLRLFIYILILQFIVVLLVYLPVSAIISSIGDSVQSEETYFYIAITGVIIHLFLIITLVLVSDYAKIMMVNDESFRPFRTILRAFAFIFKHFFSVYSLSIFYILTGVLLFITYFFLNDKIGMSSGFTILLMFIIQQLFILSRLFLKISVYGGEIVLFKKISIL